MTPCGTVDAQGCWTVDVNPGHVGNGTSIHIRQTEQGFAASPPVRTRASEPSVRVDFIVLDSLTRQPVPGITFTIGEEYPFPVTSDAKGEFAFAEYPGEHLIRYPNPKAPYPASNVDGMVIRIERDGNVYLGGTRLTGQGKILVGATV